ncbi:MAG TPA: tetratricopeptide repeat protein [Bacteroidales bacterium]|nr:tetratricopeptide repeat protein [Bacteroidales bacterium]HSA44625.1 tetratricopeptide repeat protein [Bacteroidales bacterium]
MPGIPDSGPKTGSPLKEKQKQYVRLWLLPVLLITALVMSPTLNNEFIKTWDDGVYVTDNMTITKLNADNIRLMFTTPVNGTYVPLPLLSFALEYHFFKLNPFPYHLNNLLLHLLCVVLVFHLMRLLGLKPLLAAFAAVLAGIHPMRLESVAWVTERKDLLFSVFYLLALISYTYQITREEKKRRYYILTLVFFILSLFSKIQAVSLPLVLLLFDWFFKRPLQWKLLWEKLPHFGLSLGFGLAGIFILERTGSLEINYAYSLTDRLFFGLHSLWIYLVKLVYPSPLSVYYPYPMSPGKPLPWVYYLSPVFLLLIAFLVFLTRKHNRMVIFGSLFFLFNIMFLLQILGAGQAYMADRFTYIPYLGLLFTAAWGLQYLSEKKKQTRMLLLMVMAAVTLVFSYMTFERSKLWKNSETIWTDVIRKYPGRIASAYSNRASYYREKEKRAQALQDYSIAVRLDPNNAVSIMNRGNLYFDEGRLDSAYTDYNRALKLNISKLELDLLYANFGAVYAKRQQYDSSLYYLNLSLKLDSLFPTTYLNRGLVYENTGRHLLAIADYQHYLAFEPGDDRVYSSIGVNYQHMKRYAESIPWFERGMKANPRSGLHYNNRAYSYNALGQTDKAREDIIRAMELGYQVRPEFAAYLGLKP